MRSSAWCLVVLLSAACHKRAHAPESKPIDVTSAIAGCAGAPACEASCGAGGANACIEAGRLYEFGHAGPRDAARAFPFYRHACELGSGTGCFNTALLLERGTGVERDLDEAKRLYGRACDAGSQTACARASALTGTSRTSGG